MIWRLGALACSLSYGFQMVLIKVLTRRGHRTVKILWFTMAGSVPLLLFFFYWTSPHAFDPNFPVVLGGAVTGNLFAFFGFVKAIETSDVSLVSPLLSLSPLFMLLTSWLILSEFPDLQGLAGIIAVSIGTYLLAKKPDMSGLEPLRQLWADHGVRWALVVSFVWSITANIDKLAVQHSTPIGYSFWFHVSFAMFFLPVYLYFTDWSRKETVPEAGERYSTITYVAALGLLGSGFLQALMSGSQMYAIMETDVTYIIALKRAGMLVSVLGGGLLLGEEDLKRRLTAALIVFAGLSGIIFR